MWKTIEYDGLRAVANGSAGREAASHLFTWHAGTTSTFQSSNQVLSYIKEKFIQPMWVDPTCGDGFCDPSEYPAFGRFGCKYVKSPLYLTIGLVTKQETRGLIVKRFKQFEAP